MPVFRNLKECDIEAIVALEKNVFSDAWSSQSIRETSNQKQAFITVAEEGGVVVGYCIIYFALDEAEIARIAVDESMRRQGIARRLLDYTCKCCKEKGTTCLLLDVRECNQSARAFYKNYGFAEDGIRKNFYENPKEDAVLMSMRLL